MPRKVLKGFTGTDEQKRKLLTEELSKMNDDAKQEDSKDTSKEATEAKLSIVRVSRAAVQLKVFVTLRVNGISFSVTQVLLDSGACICIFGNDFLNQATRGGALKAVKDLLISDQVYRVHGIHNTAVDTSKYLEAGVYISEGESYAFEDTQQGVTVKNLRFFYLPEAKEVFVGRPALEPAGRVAARAAVAEECRYCCGREGGHSESRCG